MKLVGLPVPAADVSLLSSLPLKAPVQRLILMGTRAKDKVAFDAAAVAGVGVAAAVVDDMWDEEAGSDGAGTKCQEDATYLALVARRVASFKPSVVAGFREGTQTLVLDIDYTLMDHKSVASRPLDMMRPYLHEMLAAAYGSGYDLVIWSATPIGWAVLKMRDMGVLAHPAYKVAAFMDKDAMIPVRTPKYGQVEVKPLGVLWGCFPCRRPQTTIMIDDRRQNFLMNPRHGLRIRACRNLPACRATERELLHLAAYLLFIAKEASFDRLHHRRWRVRLVTSGYDFEGATVPYVAARYGVTGPALAALLACSEPGGSGAAAPAAGGAGGR